MHQDVSLPSYDKLFDDLAFDGDGDGSRSVCSPAAYLADLLQLLGSVPAALVARRPDIPRVPLDAPDTNVEIPYLDIVNEVLEGAVRQGQSRDAYDLLAAARVPFALPFSLRHVRLWQYLQHLGVAPADLYRLFAVDPDPDTVAREYLGLTPADVALVTTVLADGPELRECYQLRPDEPFTALQDVERLRRATMLTAEQVRELLYQRLCVTSVGDRPAERAAARGFFVHQGGPAVTLTDDEQSLVYPDGPVPVEWFERVNRFVRLARLVELSMTDLDLVLRACCGNRIDPAALRTVAVVTYLRRATDLPVDVVVSLVAPIDTLGLGNDGPPADLFDRVFNVPFAATETAVVRGSTYLPPDYAGLAELTCTGDIMAAANAAYRRRLTAALSMSAEDLAAVVARFRTADDSGPFDRVIGLPALSLLHRISRLTAVLGIGVGELFDVLDALDSDPSIQRYPAFPLLIDPGVTVERVDAVLAGGDPQAGLWLVQTVLGAVRWSQATGLSGRELTGVLGGAASGPDTGEDSLPAVLAQLHDEFDVVALAPEVFAGDRFSDRAAQVVYTVLAADAEGVVSARDDRLLRVVPDRTAGTAYAAICALPMIVAEDFLQLGLDARYTTKIFDNLVAAGYLDTSGAVVPDRLPDVPADLRLAGDFSAVRDDVFWLVADLCAGWDADPAAAVPAGTVSLFPSDLEAVPGIAPADRAELYDNLIFNGYLNPDGLVLRPDFFTDDSNAAGFAVDADLGDIAADVLGCLRDRVVQFGRTRLVLDPTLLAALGLPAAQLTDLIGSLRFNGYLDADDGYVDPGALADLPLRGFSLALEFYPYRRRVLDAIQDQIEQARTAAYQMTEDDFRDIADAAVAQRVVAGLDGTYLVDQQVPDGLEAFFADAANTLSIDGLTEAENAAVFRRVADILAEWSSYHLELAALTDLGIDPDQQGQLVDYLVARGYLTDARTVPADQLEYFGTVHNALGFDPPGLADFSKDIFFLLHTLATGLTAAVADITAALEAQAERQRTAVFTALQDAFGVPAATVEAICVAVTGDSAAALDLLVAPALADPVPAVPDWRLGRDFRRIRGFARLAAKLNLDAAGTALAFRDQALVEKYPEPLALPAGVDGIDALLDSQDGTVYLFRGRSYWTYDATDRTLTSPQPAPLTDLSTRLAALAGVDAAFVDADRTAWIVGRDEAGDGLAFTRLPGSGRWAPRQQDWGAVTNNFSDPAGIDAAFVDDDGRTYLFCGDQYVRYSRTDHSFVDQGYPRQIGDWWDGEQYRAALPAAFRRNLDAAVRGFDGRTYLFAGDQFVAVGAEAADGGAAGTPIAGTWGRVRNVLADNGRVDAGYAAGGAQYLFAGDQVFRYSDSIENADVCVDAGYPRRIESALPGVPAEFRDGVDAAFVDPAGELHLFKDGRTVALGTEPGAVVPTATRWGQLGPVLPGGTVDAAFVGLDGRTYLFSGDRYVRYSGADYSTVDVGYPRGIAADWGGLRRVDAAFVLDGATYVFGAAGPLLDLPLDGAGELDAGRLTHAQRQRLADQGITVADGTAVTGHSPQWQFVADHGIRLTLSLVDTRIEVSCDQGTEVPFHVRYSTRDYTVPDAGFPAPLTDNWWNLPAGPDIGTAAFDRVDAVLTGRDNRTYLFAGDQFIVFDNKRRWWSAPKSLRTNWDSLPFERVDAAFVGADEMTYIFSGEQYVRYSGSLSAPADDRYPARITAFWGHVLNTITGTGRVDAALVVDSPAGDGYDGGPAYTYLFSGDQFVRYTGTSYGIVDDGYPKLLSALGQEPRLGNLRVTLDALDAAFADRRTVYLFRGGRRYAVSIAPYRRYPDLPAAATVGCAYLEDGAVLVEQPDGWRRYSALEGPVVTTAPARPRTLRTVPPEFHSGLDAVLCGVDANTYLFKGAACFNVELGHQYPFAEEWGRPRNTIYQDNRVDTAFVGVDGKTYVFSGDQFVTYTGADYLEADTEPQPVARAWAGLDRVVLGYVHDGTTYLFGPPDADGAMRYLAYSGTDYSRPDAGFPRTTDASFWDIPEQYCPAGFTVPDAVVFAGTTMLLLSGGCCLQRDEATGTWSYPRPLERIWPGIGPVTGLTAALNGHDGATYFFFAGEFARYHDQTFEPRPAIRDRWALTRNNFLTAGARVDAALVTGGVTYLFCGDQYVRYSGADYRYADTGYPRPIAGNLRAEDAFHDLPAAFEDELAERAAGGARRLVDAAVANDRTSYLFSGGACHVVSRALTADDDLAPLGRVRNCVADRQRVDAALAAGGRTFLFSGDQYVRYSGPDYAEVDDGYPRTVAESLPGELGIVELPVEFQDGIDAVFQDADGRTFLFAGTQFLRVEGGSAVAAAIGGAWGRPPTTFRPGAPIDAAFAAPTGEVYAFRGGQYVRYQPGRWDTVDGGFPCPIKDNWGQLPPAFAQGLDAAFSFGGRVYLCRQGEYVRYSGGRFDTADQAVAQPLRERWSASADYRLHDVRAISRFAQLSRTHPLDGGLAAFLTGPGVAADPYQVLGVLFGWDVEELKWCRRRVATLVGTPADEDRLDLEFLLDVADVFALAARFGTGPADLHARVWSPLYQGGTDADLDAVADALAGLLALRYGPADWPGLAEQIHDDLNVRRRDALVPAVIARSTGQEPEFRTSRDLFEWFLVDVDLGGQGRTSRVREATAATQFYLHRYLLNLEDAGPAAAAERPQVKTWWSWMRGYRLWEANRKVFLNPENYLRPELRTAKTPAFASLESDLLQGEITAAAAEQAYKRYLDEYTEVSRLTIAGGYVSLSESTPDGPRRLVLFGRTKTDPRRYYYRRAEFSDGAKLSATWEPWQAVDLRIDADRVHPVSAFGRVFVFWATVEAVQGGGDPTTTTVVVANEGGGQRVSGEGRTQQVKIYYSFYNLNGDWVPAQTLGTGRAVSGVVSGVTLSVRPGDASIVVSCAYTVTTQPAGGPAQSTPAAVLFDLSRELYADDLLDPAAAGGLTPQWAAVLANLEADAAAAATTERVAAVFVDPVDPADVVAFDHPTGSDTLSWFSVDLKGGSFLCRPATVTGTEGGSAPLAGNPDRLPEWPRVDAAVELPDGTRYFFDDAGHRYATAAPHGTPGEPAPIGTRWGRRRAVLAATGSVDAVLARGEHTFVFSGHDYLRFTGTPFVAPDSGYPKRLDRNDDGLPRWPNLLMAFTGRDGTEYFFNHGGEAFVTSHDLDHPQKTAAHWPVGVDGFTELRSALVTGDHTFLISGQSYLRYTGDGDKPDAGYPKPLAGNPDGLPTDFRIDAALWRDGTTYYFNNATREYHEVVAGVSQTRPTFPLPSKVAADQTVDAAWLGAGRLYLTCGPEYVRYTLDAQGAVPAVVDEGYPRPLPHQVDAAFTRDDDVYLFSGSGYTRIDAGAEPDTAPATRPVAGAWGELPRESAPPFDAALDSASGLYLFTDDRYVVHSKTATVRRPYERAALPFELVRLTTGTAAELNQRLLAGGVPALLDLSTQLVDEVAVGTEPPATVRVHAKMVDPTRLPTGSHLDFGSANGIYYWEIFYHAPFLIAQALNSAQRFEDAKQWYEYIFDPTDPDSYWRFLPFLAVDLDALAGSVRADLAALRDSGQSTDALDQALSSVLDALRTLAPVATANRGPATEDERTALVTVTSSATQRAVKAALDALPAAAVAGLHERVAIIAGLQAQFDLMDDRDSLLAAYRNDPFDPYPIADLRPVAHRRAIVMNYLDNLLDWGDLLFQQYTPESVDEARMLYILAYDLLGNRPGQLGPRALPAAQSFATLDRTPGALDPIEELTGGGALLTGPGAVHAGVSGEYFTIPENSTLSGYFDRVEDRLRKIRQSLNILGISQPLPLFAPPLDPMALVRAAAAGLGSDAVVAGTTGVPPAYRFAVVFRKAQELADMVQQFGAELLEALDRRDIEQLNLLSNRQEHDILAMTRDIKQSQVQAAEERVADLTAGQKAAQDRIDYFQVLIGNGLLELERAQMELMKTAAGTHFAASVLRVAAGIAHALPQIKAGPFIIGVETGGRALGASLDKAAEFSEALGAGFSATGELLGMQAQHQRTTSDWQLNLTIAQNDLAQVGHQLTMATYELAAASRDADLTGQELANNAAVAAFLRDKFGTAELYGWLSGQLSGLYFQAYQLAYDAARSAELAYQFERGSGTGFIQPVYWQSRRSGLLAGQGLGLDLARLGKAYLDTDVPRGLEITKEVSLLQLDPLAVLRLRDTGRCELSLGEALFDRDFPGHYRRQLRTVSVTFIDADGKALRVNAMLTQVSHQTLLQPDAKAVAYLLDPKGPAPQSVRSDWRPSQQIALSDVDGDDSGLFELRFDDDRYLPFESTGAVSAWRLERTGRAVADLFDVVLTVRYTAQDGGAAFADAVRGLLKPYAASRFFDVAREFPTQWSAFVDGDDASLELPFTPDLFPDMNSRQISAVYAAYDVVDGSAPHLVLSSPGTVSLDAGKVQPTPGLAVGADASAPMTFVVEGDKHSLRDIGLVLTYQALAR